MALKEVFKEAATDKKEMPEAPKSKMPKMNKVKLKKVALAFKNRKKGF